MREYHKIDTVFKRDPATKHKTLLLGDWSQDAFGYLANNEWVFTEKVDGTNIRVMIDGGNITFGGKTDDAQIPAALVQRLQERFLPHPNKDTLLAAFPDGGCLYGEGYGARIQKGGGNYRQDQDFVLFDVKVGEWWLQRDAVEDVAQKLGLDVVPIIGRGTLTELIAKVREGFNSTWGPFAAEGVVARPAVELKTRNGSRIITKLKHKDFTALATAAA
jgi:ATP-dependent RNA circularization protein (DNA/RNA ligase family)